MNISSSTAVAPSSTQIEAMEKALESDEQQVLKVLESVNEQSQKFVAQKTGLGNNLNMVG